MCIPFAKYSISYYHLHHLNYISKQMSCEAVQFYETVIFSVSFSVIVLKKICEM